MAHEIFVDKYYLESYDITINAFRLGIDTQIQF